eukprot:Protomagalhaensia_sp_Gyna_25__3280@NODE_297_length_4017_cov_72_141780_g229_i0_p2_GENE_NODE_297_length_4017_cov_72_141780_g229_i0NODE_297_length_4017_cov_72_141780_g229_i0_p2_ORF_typecomplete_len229_score22_89PTPLA/PF04387_14/1e02PTPLA/PF04387_14/6_5e52_NODE_297_length_4017_cov_72_141780_g229_i0151837
MLIPVMVSPQLVRYYLIAYNAISWLLWIRISLDLIHASITTRQGRAARFPLIGGQVKFAMTLALAEIAHAAFRIVKSDPFTTTVQVLSRLHLVYIVWQLVEETHGYASTYAVCAAWSLAEIIRYLYYVLQLVSPEVPFAMKWLRYSAFMVLYPVGIVGEMVCMFMALKPLAQFAKWPTPMPNMLNFEVSLKFVYQLVLCLYLPGGVHMYTHMLKQRKRMLYKTKRVQD